MSAEALIGQTIGGCMILEVIGQGGMGVIYKARQKSLDRIVALKVLAPHLANDVNFVSRFQKEARAIARVNHPNILAVYDVGDDQNINYMIMELIDGQSLAEVQVERRGALPWEEASTFIKQASQGLEAAQASGIIHRDIKPENLMLTKKGVIKVSDFGLAKDSDATNTSTDAVMGTPAFMSPEQCDGKNVDARSDIYSLGGTYYRLITGRLPFEAETAMSMMYRHKHEALIPPHEVVPTLPPWISAVILKMMAKKREHRYQTMTEVIDAMEEGIRSNAAPKPGSVMVAQQTAQDAPAVAEAVAPPVGRQGESNVIPRELLGGSPNSGIIPRNAVSGRLPAGTVGPGVFGGSADSGSRLGIPSGIMGMPASGLASPDDGFTNVARGDEMLQRGERMNALKAYQMALQSKTIDNATRQRIEAEIKKEVVQRRTAADNFLKRGALLEANRELKVIVDLDPQDQSARGILKDVDTKLGQRRTIVNEIRNALAGSLFEKAIKIWDTTPSELRDDSLAKQIEQLRTVVVPSLKLAEQGDNFSRQGRLEEAIATFEDALKINAACEAARQGLKDTEQKVQRIEFMLKEGLQFQLEQDYPKAIEAWAPILQIRPGHSQTIKNMVDAYMVHAQNLRAQGDVEGALTALKGAIEVDPQNRNVKRLLDEVSALNDKIQVLQDRADESRRRDKVGEAIGYWREIQKLNPSGKEAPARIAELSKRRSGTFAKFVAFVVFVAILGGAGYQYYTEMTALKNARTAMDTDRFIEAMNIVKQTSFYVFGDEAKQITKDADFRAEQQSAQKLEDDGKLDEAATAFLKLSERTDIDKQKQRLLREHGILLRSRYLTNTSMELIGKKEWDPAHARLSEITSLLETHVDNPELSKLKLQAGEAIRFLDRLREGMKVEQASKGEAVEKYKAAKRVLQQVKLPGCEEFVDARLKALGFDESRSDKLRDVGKKHIADKKYQEAKVAFEEALKNNPGDTEVPALLQYVTDLAECNSKNMSLYAPKNPTNNAGDLWVSNRKAAFCIDRYEWPNTSGGMPMVEVSVVAARALCKNIGKQLCHNDRWVDACKGGLKFDEPYPYGRVKDAAACNTNGSGLQNSGSRAGCKNTIDLYDMSGNVAEWTDDGAGGAVVARGGAYDTPVEQASCNDMTMPDAAGKHKNVGFRCCKTLPPANQP